MSRRPAPMGMLLLGMSMLAGGFAAAALADRLINGVSGSGVLSIALGVLFAALGWLLPETILETIIFLMITAVLGGVALTFFESATLRIIVIAFVCGFNMGKIGGGVYREISSVTTNK